MKYGEYNKATVSFTLPDGTQAQALLTFLQLRDNGDKTTDVLHDQMTSAECWAALGVVSDALKAAGCEEYPELTGPGDGNWEIAE